MKRARQKDDSRDDLYRVRFEEETLPYLAAVYNFAFSLTGAAFAAEDLAQETFLNAFRGFRKFEIGTNCKAWLFKICKNLFIDQFRRRVRRREQAPVETLEAASLDPPHDTRTLEIHGIVNEEVYADLFGDEIHRHLAELPTDFREALLLCDLEALSYQEIAKVINKPIGTVRSRISRARSFLRERLGQYAQDLGFSRDRAPEDPSSEDKPEGSSDEFVHERSTSGTEPCEGIGSGGR